MVLLGQHRRGPRPDHELQPSALTTWGQRVFTSTNGIQNTAERATVFGDDPDPTDPTSSPTDGPTTGGPVGGDCTAAIGVVNDWGSGWQGKVTVTATGAALDGWRLTWTWAGSTRITSSWNATITSSGAGVTAADVGWNGAVAAGQSREVFGFIGSTPAATPTVSCEAI
nr:hypothetical protein GCM10025732_53980 [Glycomyces mayteni]